jgi:hypothetical protein
MLIMIASIGEYIRMRLLETGIAISCDPLAGVIS